MRNCSDMIQNLSEYSVMLRQVFTHRPIYPSMIFNPILSVLLPLDSLWNYIFVLQILRHKIYTNFEIAITVCSC
jgi:hypothetical protein